LAPQIRIPCAGGGVGGFDQRFAQPLAALPRLPGFPLASTFMVAGAYSPFKCRVFV
jgi:hypothetical protein